jgi:hypothetical protein
MTDISDEDILKAHGLEPEVEKAITYSPQEARLIAGFEDILKFYEEHQRAPQHGDDNDIFERIYAVRLDQLRKIAPSAAYLKALDQYGLLEGIGEAPHELNDDEILANFDIDVSVDDADDITSLRHVSPIEHRRAAEEIANREVCRDFGRFKPLFDQVKVEVEQSVRETRNGIKSEDVKIGSFFILNGQMAYVADKGEEFKAPNEQHWDARLRVIFDNGTESDLLWRSLLRSANADKAARTITTLDSGPLFDDVDTSENETGTIYVLRSLSELPEIAPIRDAILKIGVTGSDVKKRVANAKNEATYLLGAVEIVDEYTLYNINRVKLERLLQRIFSKARLEITIKDRFGKPVQPNEWFLTTPAAVAEAVELIKDGRIKQATYDHTTASFEIK